jgi:hypothetical protein
VSDGVGVDLPHRTLNLISVWNKCWKIKLCFQFTYFCSEVHGYTKGPVSLF